MIYAIRDLVGHADTQTGPDTRGRWSRSVPLHGDYGRVAAAWAVLRGRAVAVRYPVSGELEQALYETGGMRVDPPLPRGRQRQEREG